MVKKKNIQHAYFFWDYNNNSNLRKAEALGANGEPLMRNLYVVSTNGHFNISASEGVINLGSAYNNLFTVMIFFRFYSKVNLNDDFLIRLGLLGFSYNKEFVTITNLYKLNYLPNLDPQFPYFCQGYIASPGLNNNRLKSFYIVLEAPNKSFPSGWYSLVRAEFYCILANIYDINIF